MERTIVLSCTNRPSSYTLKVSTIYASILTARHVDNEVLDFSTLPHNIAFSETFGHRTPDYAKLIDHFVTPNKRFIFVVPEYNGSFPGILKTFLDSIHPREWADKRACLVGVADG